MPLGSALGNDGAVTSTVGTRRPLFRDTQHAVVGGVASGLAAHLGLQRKSSRWLLRLAFVVLAFAQGFGVVLYAAFWIIVPPDPDQAEPRRRLWLRVMVAVFAAAAIIGVVANTVTGHYFVPIVLALLGAALIWRQSTETERERWVQISHSSLVSPLAGRVGLVRMASGVAMVIAGAVIVIARGEGIGQLRDAFFAVIVVVVGIALITGPLWVRTVGELAEERRERIRAVEREEMAAHLHDSVLQTLALIQRNAGSPREVARLARAQERELRTLLYGSQVASGSLAAALHGAAAEVEDDYAITVDEVVVGDAPLDEHLAAVAKAAREALINAAKHAAVASVSLYAEVDPAVVEVYVRDRGKGFQPDDIPDDRHGVRGSIEERMTRHGGTAEIRSQVGGGTEVKLRMERVRS
jgi:signal transduction histidine kinase